MSFGLECKKVKRTGLSISFLGGGLLAAAVPILNMAFRAEKYLGLSAPPVEILMNANWQMMAMLNVLIAAAGACLMYYTEYADNAVQRMCMLPIKESRLFFDKAALITVMCVMMLAVEGAGTAFCAAHWFESSKEIWMELLKSFGYALLLMLPAALCALLTASACKNIWVSLGVDVVCVFTASMLPAKNFVLSLFPFAMPFRTLGGTEESTVFRFLIAALIEIVIIGIVEVLFLKVRRSLE